MYTDTRTTAREVLDDVETEVRAFASRTESGVTTRRRHPTFITKTQLKADLDRLNGVYELAIRVAGGDDQLNEATRSAVERARAAVAGMK
jgi:hypothetical protein